MHTPMHTPTYTHTHTQHYGGSRAMSITTLISTSLNWMRRPVGSRDLKSQIKHADIHNAASFIQISEVSEIEHYNSFEDVDKYQRYN